jgi:nucleoside-diphosphate-sugar epimerase
MRVLVLGSSGFIGKSIVSKAPKNIELTGTYYKNEIKYEDGDFEHLDYLDEGLDWEQIIKPFSCIIVAARANAENIKARDNISRRSRIAFIKMLNAVTESESEIFIVAINGSLTYGHRGEDLVKTSDRINPTGFAKSYSIAESPFREYLAKKNDIAIIRAPWVLGVDSWFPQMYLMTDKIPIIGTGRQWMAIVTVNDLAEYVWQLVEMRNSGIFHPKLSGRCRQRNFAFIVQKVTKKKSKRLGIFSLLRMEKQKRESILASIKIDDREGYTSESDSAMIELENAIKDIYSVFS